MSSTQEQWQGLNFLFSDIQGFPNLVDLWGDSLGKMAKNCMKITKSTFLGQNSRGEHVGGQANFSDSG